MSKTNKSHPHAQLMLQYAQDAMETDKPYELWEYFSNSEECWRNLETHPIWADSIAYRRKSENKTVIINGREVVAPMEVKPKHGSTYYVADVGSETWWVSYHWIDDGVDYKYLKRGLCFKKEADAIAYAKALVNWQD